MTLTPAGDGSLMTAEWYYVGNYGQLGPLTLEQLGELARDGVIGPETNIWRNGMSDWKLAADVPELQGLVPSPVPHPPVLPSAAPKPGARPPASPASPGIPAAASVAGAFPASGAASLNWEYLSRSMPVSDRSRIVGGLLNLIPGVGRFYLGYPAHGALQLFLAIFGCGIGWVWSVIDGIYIMAGGLTIDGYGRRLE